MFDNVYCVSNSDFSYKVGQTIFLEYLNKTIKIDVITWNKETNVFTLLNNGEVLMSIKSDNFIVVNYVKGWRK